MSIDNPFQSPAIHEDSILPAGATLRIEPIAVTWNGSLSLILSSEEVHDLLHGKLVEYCQELGFTVTEGEADYALGGTLHIVAEEHPFWRIFTTGIVGHLGFEVKGSVEGGPGKESRAFVLTTRRHGGRWYTESSQKLLIEAVTELGYKMSTEAGLAGKRVDPREASDAWSYLRFLLLAALVAAAGCAGARYGLGMMGDPTTGEVSERKIGNEAIAAVAIFAMVSILGIALAPQWVLLSRTMYKLRASAGVSSILGMRLLLVLLAAVAAWIAYMMCQKPG